MVNVLKKAHFRHATLLRFYAIQYKKNCIGADFIIFSMPNIWTFNVYTVYESGIFSSIAHCVCVTACMYNAYPYSAWLRYIELWCINWLSELPEPEQSLMYDPTLPTVIAWLYPSTLAFQNLFISGEPSVGEWIARSAIVICPLLYNAGAMVVVLLTWICIWIAFVRCT